MKQTPFNKRNLKCTTFTITVQDINITSWGFDSPHLEAIFSIWLSPPSKALANPPAYPPPSSKQSKNSTPEIKARTMLAQNPGIQQLPQAWTSSVQRFESFRRARKKLYHLAFDSSWHFHDKCFILNRPTLFAVDIK